MREAVIDTLQLQVLKGIGDWKMTSAQQGLEMNPLPQDVIASMWVLYI